MSLPEIHLKAKAALLTEVKRLKREKGMNTLDAQREASRIVSARLKAEKAKHPAEDFCRAHREELAAPSAKTRQLISTLCDIQGAKRQHLR